MKNVDTASIVLTLVGVAGLCIALITSIVQDSQVKRECLKYSTGIPEAIKECMK